MKQKLTYRHDGEKGAAMTYLEILGWARKGVIAAGSDADIVVYDPKASHILSARDMVTKAGYTPFEGLRTEGGIAKVYLRGSLMVEDGRIVGGPEGQYLRRGLCTL